MTYQVGQILYVLPQNKMIVVPVQIVEEITKKTLNGLEVSYVVKFGKDEKQINVNEIGGEIFDSTDQVKLVLIERSTTSINDLVNTAALKAKEWYGGAASSDSIKQEDGIEDALRNNGGKPRDGNGRFVQTPAVASVPVPQPRATNDGKTSVQLEDGTVVNVKMPDVLG